jgi:uncharacterized protein YebE (UPF0316 family)
MVLWHLLIICIIYVTHEVVWTLLGIKDYFYTYHALKQLLKLTGPSFQMSAGSGVGMSIGPQML